MSETCDYAIKNQVFWMRCGCSVNFRIRTCETSESRRVRTVSMRCGGFRCLVAVNSLLDRFYACWRESDINTTSGRERGGCD